MVRAPCCEKMGLKKGPWTPEEDHILITYIQQYGHGNWRALPKQAGLLRCGKSCRLRWTNYLRPDIKRGNFSREEEDTIINLHQMLGNRWSAIAARLPGRTDNEIKNVWHTHLKKRLQQQQNHTSNPYPYTKQEAEGPKPEPETVDYGPVSPPQCTTSSDTSSVTTTSMKVNDCAANNLLPEVDENFWSEVLSAENCGVVVNDFEAIGADPQEPQVNLEPIIDGFSSDLYDHSMDFWYSVFTRAEDQIPELLQI